MLRLVLFIGILLGQCLPFTPPNVDCNTCNPIPYSPDIVVPAGQTFCIPSGQTYDVNSLSILIGAKLIVCGTLIVNDNVDLFKASIIVATGGKLFINSNLNINALSSVINFGSLIVQNNIALNGGSSIFVNYGTSAITNVKQDIIVNASSYFYNYSGIINTTNITLNGNAQMCLYNNACVYTKNLTSNGNYNVYVGEGLGVINYVYYASLNGTLTNSDGLYICKGPGATVNNPANWGTAEVIENCTGGCGPFGIYKKDTSNVVHKNADLKAYPNCFDMEIRVSSDSVLLLELYDANGVLLVQKLRDNVIHVDSIGAGIYSLIVVTSDGYVRCFKMAKCS